MLRALAIAFFSLFLLAAAAPASAAVVKVTVNGTPITDFQIAQRLKLFQLEGRSGQTAAVNELIDEALMIQEAKRLGITISDGQVRDAFLNVARNIRVSEDKLRDVLGQAGVNVETLYDRLRAAIAWQNVVQAVISPRVQISDLELEIKAAAEAEATSSFDYILKEIVFVTAGGQGASQRTAQANQYRRSFTGCDGAVQLSLSYTDAAVINVGRRHATQLPDAIAEELAGLNVGGITKPRVMDHGVSMLAVCSKTEARDLTFAKDELRQAAGDEALKGEAETYLAGLRQKANIVRN